MNALSNTAAGAEPASADAAPRANARPRASLRDMVNFPYCCQTPGAAWISGCWGGGPEWGLNGGRLSPRRVEPIERVERAHRKLGIDLVDQHRELDLGSGDGANVDALLGQGPEGARGDAGMRAHADADGRDLHHVLRPVQLGVADLRPPLLEDGHG